MSTFVVRFVGDGRSGFRGRVRHVASGEEILFASIPELIAFLEGINAMSGIVEEAADPVESKRREKP